VGTKSTALQISSSVRRLAAAPGFTRLPRRKTPLHAGKALKKLGGSIIADHVGVSLDPTSEPAASPLQAGQIIGERYLVGEVLGGGGMGVVRAGTHVLLGTPVAIKVIHSDLKDDAEVVQRFINEARVAAALKGEHIARVFDVGLLDSGEPYLVMEQLEGMGLDHYLAGRGPLPVAQAIDIVLQICEGLAEAHAAGLVHRDIKPANLFLARRPDEQLSVKILDFGIAKRLDTASPALTDPGKSLGSPWYMSPEQMLTPASVDAHADVWSLGVLLFELLTARLPFEGESVPRVCANVLAAPAPRPSQHRGDLDPELDAIVLHCLEKEPGRRLGSVSELAQVLRPFASSPLHTAAAEPLSTLEARQAPTYDSLSPLQGDSTYLSSRSSRRRRSWPLALALVAVAVLPAVWLQLLNARPALPATDLGAASPGAGLTREPPMLLQYLHETRAIPEVYRPTPSPTLPPPVANNEAWLRAQQLKRLHDAENKYGL
jgi:eukaryotic-like serine/threonine-protein kinase